MTKQMGNAQISEMCIKKEEKLFSTIQLSITKKWDEIIIGASRLIIRKSFQTGGGLIS